MFELIDGKTQEIRAMLRERFLKASANVHGKQCCFKTVNGCTPRGIFRGADVEFHNILAENLENTSSKLKNVLMRSDDIVFVEFNNI